jgi:hypothetical protein
MTAYAKPTEEKHVLVRMGPGADGNAVLAGLRGESAAGTATAQADCVAFCESRRSGNIAVAVVPKVGCGGEETEIAGRIHQAKPFLPSQDEAKPSGPDKSQPRSSAGKAGNPTWRFKGATRMSPQPTSKSPVGMPAAAASIGKNGQLLGTPGPLPPGRDVIADIMDQNWRSSETGSAATSLRPTMHRAKVDIQLARIIDAWPGLSPATREALAAVLDSATAAGAECKAEAAAVESHNPQPEIGKDHSPPEAGEPRRRRTRKTASPPPPEAATQ